MRFHGDPSRGKTGFRIVTGTAFGQHDAAWIRQHAPDDGSVLVTDVTSATRLSRGSGGRASRELLQPLTTSDLSTEAFPYLTGTGDRRRAGAVPRGFA